MNVIASITTSVDGYVAGPDDGPGVGLGRGGERLHYWVMGGPWTYDNAPEDFAMSGADKEFLDELTGNLGAGVCGRGMYDSSEAWGGSNPFDGPLFVVTHRTEDAPDPSTGFHFVDGLEAAMQRATAAGRDVSISGRRRDPPSPRRRLRRRAGDLHGPARAGRRQAPVRRLRARRRARGATRLHVAVRDARALQGQALMLAGAFWWR
jgi:dihydrofolate reductase